MAERSRVEWASKRSVLEHSEDQDAAKWISESHVDYEGGLVPSQERRGTGDRDRLYQACRSAVNYVTKKRMACM